MDDKKRIVVVAGNRSQFQYWLRHNIIPILCKDDLHRLEGVTVKEIYYEGSYHNWFDKETEDTLLERMS